LLPGRGFAALYRYQTKNLYRRGDRFGEELEAGMRRKIAVLVAFALVLQGIASSCALLGGSSNVAVDLMKRVPGDSASFSYWAVDKIDSDEELWEVYAVFRESLEADQVKDTGLALSIVEHASKASWFNGLVNGSAKLLKGKFGTGDMERRLEREGYTKGTSQEIRIWTPPGELGYQPVALQDEALMIGDSESLTACIDTRLKDEESSLYENPNVRLVVDRLPTGVLLYVDKASSASEERYDDLVVYGRSYRKGGSGKLELTAIYLFQDSYTAGQALNAIKDHLATKKFQDIKGERQENFIRATGEIYVTDFVESLVF
jgi:hypothetical protein